MACIAVLTLLRPHPPRSSLCCPRFLKVTSCCLLITRLRQPEDRHADSFHKRNKCLAVNGEQRCAFGERMEPPWFTCGNRGIFVDVVLPHERRVLWRGKKRGRRPWHT